MSFLSEVQGCSMNIFGLNLHEFEALIPKVEREFNRPIAKAANCFER
jgi:hypothetical protein